MLYRARYSGRDHVGRWGNYFVHALVFDSSTFDRASGGLPIDQWESPVWQNRATVRGELSVLGQLPSNPRTSQLMSDVQSFLARPQLRSTLAALVATVRARLSGGRRLVLQVRGSHEAALWIAAISYSLPRHLADDVTFVTYTARPDAHQALLVFTTPDVFVPRYGNYDVLDLTADEVEGPDPIGAYDQLVAARWADNGPQPVLEVAARVCPPLEPVEFDIFAALLALPTVVPGSMEEAELLAALEFGCSRLPDLVPPWNRLQPLVGHLDRLREVSRWGELLRQGPSPVPGPLLTRYVNEVLDDLAVGGADGGSAWFPPVDEDVVQSVVEQRLAPALLSPQPPTGLLHWMETNHGAQQFRSVLFAVAQRQLQLLARPRTGRHITVGIWGIFSA